MSGEKILMWFMLMAPIAYSPGPNNLMCAAFGGKYGLRKTLKFIAGLNVNIIIYSILFGLGVGKIFEIMPLLIDYVKYVGAVYILYLAYKFYKSSVNGNTGMKETEKVPGFFTGILLNAVNPKGIAALFLMYSQFIDYKLNLFNQVLFLTALVSLMSISSHLIWTFGSSYIAGKLTTERAIRIQGISYSIMLVIVAFWLIL